MDNNRISALKRRIEENKIRSQEAREALDHHLCQLQRRSVTLEDSVCEILRKVIALLEDVEELDRLTDGSWRE